MTVKRYELENGLIQLTGTVTQQSEVHERFTGTHDVVLASDYDALAAEFAAVEKQGTAAHEACVKYDARVQALEAALRKLKNEAASLRAYEDAIRYEIGNTNWECLMLRVREADALLTPAETEPKPFDPLEHEQSR